MKIRKKEPGFPASLVEYAKQFVRKTGMFYCGRQRLSDEVSQINIQRGIIRTNCIDSLDRTNEGQEYIGLYVFLKQLKRMGVILKIRDIKVTENLMDQKFKKIFDDMGDAISL